jgi:hypothetical protein
MRKIRISAILSALALTIAMLGAAAGPALASVVEDSAIDLAPGEHLSGSLTANSMDSYRIVLPNPGMLTVSANTISTLTDANVSILTSALQQAPGSPATSWRLPYSATLYLEKGTYYVTVASKGSGSTFTGDYAIAAEFTAGHKVTTLSENMAYGTAASASYAAADATVNIAATPAQGYVFDQWEVTSRTESTISLPEQDPYVRVERDAIIANKYAANTTFTFPAESAVSIPGDVVITAKFKAAFSITLTQSTGGTAYSNKTNAAAGETVTLSATPASGYAFSLWTVTQGGITVASSTSASATFTMPNGNVAVTAQYKKQTQITASTAAGGYLRADRYTAYAGETIAIYATSESGYAFEKWNVTGATINDPYAESTWITVGETNVTLSATFTKKDPATTYYTITVSANNTSYGRVSASTTSALKDTTITITAAPVSGSSFDRWTILSGNIVLASSTSMSTTFKMPESNVRVQAVFTRTSSGQTLELAPSSTTAGSVSASTLNAVNGEAVSIRAIPKIGYKFTNWQVSGGASISDTSSPITTLTMGASNASVRANFAQSSGFSATAWHDYAAILNSERPFSSSADMAKRLSGIVATGGVVQYPIILIKDASSGSYYTNGAIDTAHPGAISAISSEYSETAELVHATAASRATVHVYIYKKATTADMEAVNNSLVTALLHNAALSDVAASASDWARDDINYAYSLGLVPDGLLGSFQNNITREEYCRIAVCVLMAAKGYKGDLDGFADVNGVDRNRVFSDTYDLYVTTAYTLGVVKGVGGNRFAPNSSITRQEAAVMASRAAGVLGMEANGTYISFADANLIASWAKEGVDFASSSGLMIGTGDNAFSPLGTYTREQAIVTLLRLYRAAP